ncbi:MAG: putative toxin-antitoxin system toxin component, PIN family [Opitutaceae bacterium]
MKLVVDTNLLVSGSLWHGLPARLVDALIAAPGTLCLSPGLLRELGETLRRPEFARRFSAQGLVAEDIVTRFQRVSRRVEPAVISPPAELRDPGDLIVLAAVVGAEADALVTGDNDLLVLGEFRGVPILRVEDALRLLALTTRRPS